MIEIRWLLTGTLLWHIRKKVQKRMYNNSKETDRKKKFKVIGMPHRMLHINSY